MVLTELKKSDINSAVEIHMAAFPNFFLTRMGADFLRAYYRGVGRIDDGILLGVYDDHGVLRGFCAAAACCDGFNKKLLAGNICALGWQAFKLCFSRPASLWHIFKNFTKKSETANDGQQYAELLSIAVSPTAQGQGYGKALIVALETELARRGVKENSLTTDAENNDGTIAFYRNCGYDVLYEFTAYPERRMFRMNKRMQK